ncbi:MAG TPA: FGGY family carbohydrate kinase, partial [Kofleriaceae bacterium]|nr:FGGY family carbohydrate kinase [Kofleriaceae bacterium]
MPSHSTRTLWLGIDLGTQSAKAALWQAAAGQRGGCVVGEGSYRYDVHYPRLGWAEQAPRDWEAALGPIVQAALTQAGARKSEVAAIGVTGQLDGTIAVDPAGEPVSPALIWQDRRASCALSLSASRVQELTGQVLDASHLAPKARYLLGERGLAGVRFHQPVSYLVERLTGRAVMDPALASMTLLLDLHARRWSAELCAAWGVPLTCLPELAPADELAAPLSARGAALTGLPAGVPVCVGTGDDFAAALGAGLLRPGRVSCSLGTAEVVGALSDTAVIDRVTDHATDRVTDHVTGHAAPIVETHLYPTGVPQIFAGDELGLTGLTGEHSRTPMPWRHRG